ncbi:MAG: hypothetical protein QOK28_2288 [Actinomycetota bacterium]|jgi:8-oxo-dGTP pyrophosphatase MutT (NUDIX family)
MNIRAEDVSRLIDLYLKRFPQEASSVSELRSSVADVGADMLLRSHMSAHITCGAILLNGHGKVLLVRHRALDRWLTPGGHVEPDDPNLEAAARRELLEETGVRDGVVAVFDEPVQIDRHPIPASPSKNEGDHEHWDFRFLFTCEDAPVALQADEVSDFQWRDISELPSALRSRVEEVSMHG